MCGARAQEQSTAHQAMECACMCSDCGDFAMPKGSSKTEQATNENYRECGCSYAELECGSVVTLGFKSPTCMMQDATGTSQIVRCNICHASQQISVKNARLSLTAPCISITTRGERASSHRTAHTEYHDCRLLSFLASDEVIIAIEAALCTHQHAEPGNCSSSSICPACILGTGHFCGTGCRAANEGHAGFQV
jgi:hypothetical protein